MVLVPWSLLIISLVTVCHSFQTVVSRRRRSAHVVALDVSSKSDDGDGGDTASSRRMISVDVVQGPFHPNLLKDYWGRQPLLIRQAFPANDLMNEQKIWPQCSELMDLAAYVEDDDDTDDDYEGYDFSIPYGDDENDPVELEDDEESHDGLDYRIRSVDEFTELPQTGESARLITHTPNQLDSFHMEMGPFDENELQTLVFNVAESSHISDDDNETKWTLLVNDVDRYKPALAEWMDRTFAFLPRWRRDDAQISIAPPGGGIGPHVDNYDVFLIQAQGARSWKVGQEALTVSQEMDSLIDGINVRILQQEGNDRNDEKSTNNTQGFSEWQVEAGDVLYLPPRVVHWGTASSGQQQSSGALLSLSSMCMTLSVGCRAPSAADLMARIAEQMATSVAAAATARFQDVNLLKKAESDSTKGDTTTDSLSPSLTAQVKQQMGALAENALQELINDSSKWDELVGKTVTEPNRFLDGAVLPYDDIWDDDFLDRWGKTAAKALRRIKKGRGMLRRAEGVSFATSTVVVDDRTIHRLFGFGQMWQVEEQEEASTQSERIFSCIERGLPISGKDLEGATAGLLAVLEDLIAEGMLRCD